MTTEDFIAWRNIAIVPCFVAVPYFLMVVLCREWVKSDITNRGFRPIRVLWRPFSWWVVRGPVFRVLYSDAAGVVHEALCGLPNWHRPVRWRET
jgi:hypothetical protein